MPPEVRYDLSWVIAATMTAVALAGIGLAIVLSGRDREHFDRLVDGGVGDDGAAGDEADDETDGTLENRQ